jgi:hypothetical protein
VKRFLFIIGALLLITGVGVLSFVIGKNLPQSQDQQSASAAHTPAKEYYTVVLPHNGPLWKTEGLIFTHLDSGMAIAPVHGDFVPDIKPGQNVFLYDYTGTMLPAAGQVRQILPSSLQDDPTRAEIIIDLPSAKKALRTVDIGDGKEIIIQPQSHTAPPATGALVVAIEYNAKRLPLSCLQWDEKSEQLYIWVATPSPEADYKASISRRYITPLLIGETLMDVGTQVKTDEMVVYQPDDTLQEGDVITTDIGSFPAPLTTPLYDAKQNYNKNTTIILPELDDIDPALLTGSSCQATF